MSLDEKDIVHLERALELAELGRGCTSPNPVVGAVIVRGSEILGEGWHVGAGRDHAEVAAIKDVLRRAGRVEAEAGAEKASAAARALCSNAVMYVTLEPCCTYGRTPPCTSAIRAAGFTRVVVGAIDPNPQVDGKGVGLLRSWGVEVDLAEGESAHRARRQNDGQRKAARTGLPFVTYKYALTLDGRVATDTGDSRWISGEDSRALVHRWRAWSDAVMVGAGTAATDDPLLTARAVPGARQPLRVVVGRELPLRRESRLAASVEEGPVLVVCGADVDAKRRAEVEAWGVETVAVAVGPDGRLAPLEVARHLGLRSVQTVLLEGGPTLAGAWWAAGLVDKVAAFICPLVVSGSEHRGALRGEGVDVMADSVRLQEVEVVRLGDDVLVTGYTGGPF